MLTDRQIEIIKQMQKELKTNGEIRKVLCLTRYFYIKKLKKAYEKGIIDRETLEYNSHHARSKYNCGQIKTLREEMSVEEMAKKLNLNKVTVRGYLSDIRKERLDNKQIGVEQELPLKLDRIKILRKATHDVEERTTREFEMIKEYQHHILFKNLKTGRNESISKANLLILQTENRLKELKEKDIELYRHGSYSKTWNVKTDEFTKRR